MANKLSWEEVLGRDWKSRPPRNLEEGFLFAEFLAQSACDSIARQGFGEPHVERRERSVVIVWPDGEVTNEVSVEYKQ